MNLRQSVWNPIRQEAGSIILVLLSGVILGLFLTRYSLEISRTVLPLSSVIALAVGISILGGIAATLLWLGQSWLLSHCQGLSSSAARRLGAAVYPSTLLLLVYIVQPWPDISLASTLLAWSVALMLLLQFDLIIRPSYGSASRAASSWGGRVGKAIALPAILFVLSFALYWRTLAPSVLGGDSGEFQFVSYVLGIAHPPGYPLYTLLGKLFSFIPVGNVAYRLNMMSAFFAASTVPFVYLITLNVLPVGCSKGGDGPFALIGQSPLWREIPAILAAMVFAVSATWWSQATVAAVRSLSGLLVAIAVYMLCLWLRSREFRWLGAFAFAFGLGLTHHISLGSFALPFLFFILLVEPKLFLDPGKLGRLAALFLAPLLVYLYLPVRSAMGTPFDPAHPTTLGRFWELVSAQGFRGDMFYFGWSDLPQRLDLLRELLLAQYSLPGLVLGLLGIAVTLCWRPRLMVLLGLTFLSNVIVGLTYRAPVITDYLIPSYLIFAIWIGVAGGLMLKMVYRGVGLVGRSLSGIVVNYAVSLATGLLAVLLLTFPVHMAIRNWPGLDYSQDRAAERFGMGALQNAKKEAVIMADWEHATILWYYQLVEGLRPDLQVKYVHPEGEIVPWLRRAEGDLARGVVYLTRYDPEIARRYRLRPAGPLVEVCSEPDFQMPAAMKQVGANFANKVKLLGYKLSRSKAEPGGSVHVTLYWQALERMDRSYNVFVHLIDAQKRIWGQRDGVPVKGYYPTNRWVQGEVIADEYELMVLPFTRPGEYALEVGAYETPTPTTWRRLPLLGTDGSSQGDSVQLGTVQVISCDYPLLPAAFPLHRNFGNVVELLGYDLVRKSGDGLSLTTYWRALRPLHTDYRMFIGVDGDASGPADRLGGRYPTSAWVPGELVRERREVRLSSSKATVSHLTLGLIDAMGRDVPLLGGWLIPRDDRLEIAVLSDPTPLRVDFNGQFLLLGYTLSKTRLKPGDSLTVSLRWQALRKIDEDCSIFVHLLDKNGRLVAQDDGVPVYGGFPTTRWVTGHAVTDRHTLRLGAEALPGEYHLQVGVYPSRTEQRLPVLDEELALALQGDRLLLGSVWVGTKPAE